MTMRQGEQHGGRDGARASAAVAHCCARRDDRVASRPALTRLLTLFAWLAMIAATSGCTSFRDYVGNGFKVGPDYLRPTAPVANDWIDEADVRVRGETADLSSWWHVFRDPVLDGLVTRAYQQNLTLREAGFRVLAARAQLGIAVGTFFPQQQNAFGNYSRNAVSRTNANTGFLPQQFYDQWNIGFALAWELDFWGRFRRAIEAADADLDSSVENYDDVLVTLLGDVASTYVRMRVFEAELELVHGNIELQRKTLQLATARFRGGNATELDVDQAQSNLSQTESLAPQFEIQIRVANNALCVLLGIPPEDLRKLVGTSDIPVAPIDVSAGIPADLLARRPDVRRAERQVAAQSARLGVATSELYPHISINGNIGSSAQVPGHLFTTPAFQGVASPGFQWNLLNYGRLLNNIRLQDARLQELIVDYQQTVLDSAREVENGIITFLRSQKRADYLAESVVAAQRAVEISLAQYRGGTVDFNRVALLQQNLVQQQDLQAQARGAIALGLIDAYRALGGGWQIRLAAPQELAQLPAIAPNHLAPEPLPVPGQNPPPQPAAPPGEARVRVIDAVSAVAYLAPQAAADAGAMPPTETAIPASMPSPTTTGAAGPLQRVAQP
jgi:NodT family efflux transporter outer membrane factor (OMF) lipoprotein